MAILVINSGSSSIKADVIDVPNQNRLQSFRVQRVGTEQCVCIVNGVKTVLSNANHATAVKYILSKVTEPIGAVGHRVVHGGERFVEPTRITSEVLSEIKNLTELAPLHIPANVAGIEACMTHYPETLQVAVFDTAFHSTLPRRAKYYAIDGETAAKHGIRRFGFHGLSHRWSAVQVAKKMDIPLEDLRIVVCHLGNGASACAVEYGRSIETSMGMTPLEGLVMGTRAGDVDAGALIALAKKEGWSLEELDTFLNRKSGLTGLSGVGNDMRDILERAREGDDRCRLAINVFVHRLRKYIGSYAAVMGGIDALVFTGGIGYMGVCVVISDFLPSLLFSLFFFLSPLCCLSSPLGAPGNGETVVPCSLLHRT